MSKITQAALDNLFSIAKDARNGQISIEVAAAKARELANATSVTSDKEMFESFARSIAGDK